MFFRLFMSKAYLLNIVFLIVILPITNATANDEQRYALVVGNAAYAIGALDNPLNDAKDISQKLEVQNFKVTTLLDASSENMSKAITDFYRKIQSSKAASVFYYAGHAMQINNVNYLLPVDVQVQSKEALLDSSVSLNYLLRTMRESKSRTNIVILDACRNNPFVVEKGVAGSRGISLGDESGKGLAPVEAPPGTFIAYSTEPGRVAQDGAGRNGTYTKHLLTHITTATDVETMFKLVRKDVMKETRQKQIPWEHSSLYSNFLFKKNDAQELPTIPSF